jgi:hypothetical protein
VSSSIPLLTPIQDILPATIEQAEKRLETLKLQLQKVNKTKKIKKIKNE